MRVQFHITLAIGCLLMAGCAVGPNYVKPKPSVEPTYTELSASENTNSPPIDWWKTFHDAELEKLINKALQTNFDLRMAYARVRQSRFQRNIVAADLFPQVDADAGYIHARGSKNVVLPLGGSGGSSGGSGGSSATPQTTASGVVSRAASQPSSASQTSQQNDSAFDNQLTPFGKGGLPGAVTDLYQAGFDANWEIDVFGGKRRQVEAANADLAAARETRRQMALTIMAEVARDYFELCSFQQRRDIARQNLEAQSNILVLTQSRVQAGLAPEADTVQAEAEVEATAASIPPLTAQVRISIHALSILVGQEPSALATELNQVPSPPSAPPIVSVGLPSDLIERRPDIRAAERSLAAANARVGSAQADLFPKFALTASAGLDSTSIQNLFDWDSRYFLISPTVTWRIFDAGRIMSNIRLQKSIKDEAGLQYQSTLLKALQEVEDSLVIYGTDKERQDSLNAAYEKNNVALDLVKMRYEHGLVTFLEVLDAERTVLSSQDELARSTGSCLTDLVALYKALGGGWQ